ncbi:MAG TPA: hypothetical protein PKJ05_03470 [Bacillota bacterium]|nr:hypothetical protein [Bacillota bacterium]
MSSNRGRGLYMLLVIASSLLIILTSSINVMALPPYEFSWPRKGSIQLNMSGEGFSVSFSDPIQLTAKASIGLILVLDGWKHDFLGSMVVKNGELPAIGVLKVGPFGAYWDKWRISSTYGNLNVSAGDIAAQGAFAKYLPVTTLYGGAVSLSGKLTGALKDFGYSVFGMAGQNSLRRAGTATTLNVAGAAFQADYKGLTKASFSLMEGINAASGIKLASGSVSNDFSGHRLTLEGALSEETSSGREGWYASLSYVSTYNKKYTLSSNVDYTSSGFQKITPSFTQLGGQIYSGASLIIALTPAWKGSESVTLKAGFSKDNIEKAKASSITTWEGSALYSASGFAPSSTGSASISLVRSYDDLEVRKTDTTKLTLDLKYSYTTVKDKATVVIAFTALQVLQVNHVNDLATVTVTDTASLTVTDGPYSFTGKGSLYVVGSGTAKTITMVPDLEMTLARTFDKPAITISARAKLSSTDTINYSTSKITAGTSYLIINPVLSWKVLTYFNLSFRYTGTLKFGSLVPEPSWTNSFGLGLGFKI